MTGINRFMVGPLFYKGQYQAVLARTCDAPGGIVASEDLPHVIGALVFLGRLGEAEARFAGKSSELTPDGRSEARFYLGVGCCRQLQHAKARFFFAANLRSRRVSDRARFFALQGIAFYRFTYGRLPTALASAADAAAAATRADFLYGRILAADLTGHALAQLGRPAAAMRQLRLARQLATVLEQTSLVEAVDYALVVYSAQYGMDPNGDVASLQELLGAMTYEDNYSRAMLLLELARQHTLRGAATRAKCCLDQASPLIFGHQNLRHEVLLNLGYAHLLHLAGEDGEAMNLLQTCRRLLTSSVDQTLELRLAGLEQRVASSLGLADAEAALAGRIERLTRVTGRLAAARISARQSAKAKPAAVKGEDPLGDLVDLAHTGQGPKAVAEILGSGFLLLLYNLAGVKYPERVLLLDLAPGALTAFDQGDVVHAPNAVSRTLRLLLLELSKGERSKEQLAASVWDVDYHPLKHDAKVYGAISRLRQILGARASWIIGTDQGYKLAPGVTVRFHEEIPAEAATDTAAQLAAKAPPLSLQNGAATADLNLRQLKILDHIRSAATSLDVRSCADLFAVSTVTASRDLSCLEKQQLVRRVGKGRATKYVERQGAQHAASS